MAAVLGALMAQIDFGVGAIGGKDSMSGSFEDLDVPPTLVSFATAIGNIDRITSPELKEAGDNLIWVSFEDALASSVCATFDAVEHLIGAGIVRACASGAYGGLAETLVKAAVGNGLGITVDEDIDMGQLFEPAYGTFVIELAAGEDAQSVVTRLEDAGLDANVDVVELGQVTSAYELTCDGQVADLAVVQEAWERGGGLESVFPYRTSPEERAAAETVPAISFEGEAAPAYHGPALLGDTSGAPRVVIPVFPGTNCEYDTAKAFARAGADPEILVVRNLTPADVAESCKALVKAIDASQIVMLPGGFSGGDEPDGSAKFIASFFRNPAVTEAVRRLLQQRDGLMLGICNGFQALIKLGLVPYGDIRPITACDPTLTFNTIGRHQSMLVHTRVASTGSPWLSKCEVGEMHTIAISHGEGRFVAPQEVLDTMLRNGQVATQYVDLTGVPTMDQSFNPNGSVLAIEGITSPDGRVFGKMGHSERSGEYLYKNVTGDKYQPIFEGGVDYFKV